MAASKLKGTILNAADLDAEVVDVPEWGVKVEVRGMTGAGRARFFKAVNTPNGTPS